MGNSIMSPLISKFSNQEASLPISPSNLIWFRSTSVMDQTPIGDKKRQRSRSSVVSQTTVHSLEHDILCFIFSFLDFFDLVRCSVVCKSWNSIVNKSKLLQLFCYKQQQMGFVGVSNRSSNSEESLKLYLEEIAMKHHRLALQEGVIHIDQWKGHSAGVDQCRMKMGLLLTGVGDKIVGLVGTRICIWRRNGTRSIFSSRESTFSKGLCMRYFDPEAVVGCEDGTARVFDMYSRKCSQIIRMHAGPITSLCLSDDQLILSGSSLGSITISGLQSDQRVAKLRSTDSTAGIRTLCFNPCSHVVFAGSTAGYASCWDLRTMRSLWETRISPNVIYSLQLLRNDKSTLVAGGIDGVLRILNQNTGEVVSSIVLDGNRSSSQHRHGAIERFKGRRLSEDTRIDSIPGSSRRPITCLAVGMKKVVTTHNSRYIRLWKFNK
ncbi:F-box/WD-40 repeat-containing protein At3g52030-like isoform X3 [Ziziphus jujuba]|uniref:F-box/WD-40 repeat-containing protein At3g52030-like isoform X3 n=1 Tax=Ziziphus jujuba TaxID=326968 RepID=A0ABM4A0Q6_ZIZJJ|nr:F-box/WD-40 repeat-containing protein At3g52030-like isoform X3 [Ziziphus jujuba]